MPARLKKKSDLTRFDAVIIGAGPAGTCAALRLLQLGYRVAIVEHLEFPRFQIGESLSPGIWNIFEYLRAEKLLTRPEYIRDLPARVIWEQPAEKLLSSSERGPGIMVDRARFDLELLDLCRRRGAHIFQPARLTNRTFTGGNWHLEIQVKTVKHRIHSFFIFDARGKSGVASADRFQTSPLSVGIWAHLPARYFPKATLVEAIEDGWLWGAPLPDKQFRVMAFVDPGAVRSGELTARFSGLLRRSRLFNIPDLPELADCSARPVQLFWNARAWRENYIHLGESAFALDPLSSTGVEKAMRFSLQAVIAFNTIIKRADAKIAEAFYREKLLAAVAVHTNWTREFYARSWVDDSRPFWAKRRIEFYATKWRDTAEEQALTDAFKHLRAANADDPGQKSFSVNRTLFRLAGIRLKLSADLKYGKMPCIVGDFLEMKDALIHPALRQPTAFLGNVEIVPLLVALEPVFTIESVIDRWTGPVGRQTSVRLAVSLWAFGVFEEIGRTCTTD